MRRMWMVPLVFVACSDDTVPAPPASPTLPDSGVSGHNCLEGTGDPCVIADGQVDPYALALDGDDIYWIARGAGSLWRATKAGGAVEHLADVGALPNALAIGASEVYVTTTDAVVAVAKAGGAVRVIAANRPSPLGVATDGIAVYWTELGDSAAAGRIMSNLGFVVTGETGPSSLAVDSGTFYWTTLDGRLRTWSEGATAPSTLASGQYEGESITLDTQHVFWVSRGSYTDGHPNDNGFVCKTPRGTPSEPLETTDYLNLARLWPGGVATDGQSAFFTNGADGTVVRVPIQGQPFTELFGVPVVIAAHQPAPYAIVVDDQFVYFTDRARGEIERVTK